MPKNGQSQRFGQIAQDNRVPLKKSGNVFGMQGKHTALSSLPKGQYKASATKPLAPAAVAKQAPKNRPSL